MLHDGWIICSNNIGLRSKQVEINILFKIAAVGILVTLLGQVLKHSGRDELAFLVSLTGFLLVVSWVIPYIIDLFESVKQLFEV